MKRRLRVVLVIVAVLLLIVAASWIFFSYAEVPVLQPGGWIAEQQRDLIIFTVLLALVVVVPVFVLLAVFAIKYRAGRNVTKYRPEAKDKRLLEALWWGIPIAIITVLSVVTYITTHTLDPYKPIKSDKPTLEVQVVALQWKWLFIYPEEGVASVGDLIIPAKRPIHFSLTADAPMSAFWIPALGSQIYSMNSMSSQLNLIANEEHRVYKGYNTNINGEGYAKMTFDVMTVDDDFFESWNEKLRQSSMTLDYEHFEELAKPSIETVPMRMKLGDKDLYKKIVAKNMSDTNDDATMNQMDHEGMNH